MQCFFKKGLLRTDFFSVRNSLFSYYGIKTAQRTTHNSCPSGLQLHIRCLCVRIRFAVAHLRHAQKGKRERDRAVDEQ